MSDASGRPRVLIQVSPEGDAAVSLLAADSTMLLGFGAQEHGEIGISINRPPGVPALTVRWNADGGLQGEVWEEPGRPVQCRVVPAPQS